MRYYLREFAFTLVELAIVLIIIGFIIAGISAGTSMVQAARLNGVVSEMREFSIAIQNFRSRYNGLPGDIATASSIVPGCDASCNGNGNGLIVYPGESGRLYQILGLLGFIKGTYNGSTMPPGKSITSGAPVWITASSGGQMYNIPAFTINSIALWSSSSIISGADAYSIDRKTDDGNPQYGILVSVDASGTTRCIISANGNAQNQTYSGTDLSYNVTQTSLGCNLLQWYTIDAR